MNKKNRYILISDIHGSSRPIQNLYQRRQEELSETNNYLICLGDFGALYYFDNKDEKFKETLGTYPFTYFVIRGNHEARPSERAYIHRTNWEIEPMWGGYVWVEKKYPYIKYAFDTGGVYDIPLTNTETLHTLVIPGAYSVDKEYRLTKNWFWDPHEQLSTKEMEDIALDIENEDEPNYDLVLSHTCPLKYQPKDLFIGHIDQSTVDNTTERFLDWIEENINYTAWCWGHYEEWREYPAYKDGRRRLIVNSEHTALLNDVMDNILTSMVLKY